MKWHLFPLILQFKDLSFYISLLAMLPVDLEGGAKVLFSFGMMRGFYIIRFKINCGWKKLGIPRKPGDLGLFFEPKIMLFHSKKKKH